MASLSKVVVKTFSTVGHGLVAMDRQRLIALFLVFLMVLSSVAYVISLV